MLGIRLVVERVSCGLVAHLQHLLQTSLKNRWHPRKSTKSPSSLHDQTQTLQASSKEDRLLPSVRIIAFSLILNLPMDESRGFPCRGFG